MPDAAVHNDRIMSLTSLKEYMARAPAALCTAPYSIFGRICIEQDKKY
jgi:hypothetical protein